MGEADVFTVDFECGNCGEEWSDSYAERTHVGRLREESSEVMVNRLDCPEFGVDACDCCGPITCPNCKLIREVQVADRTPAD